MLPKQCRITENEDFSYIVKTGVKKASVCCVVYVVSRETAEYFSLRAGFIVSKKVGNAVIRNLIKRRLREIVADFYRTRSTYSTSSLDVVIRALPSSAHSSYDEMRSIVYDFLGEFV